MNLPCDLDLENNNLIFTQNIPAYDNAPSRFGCRKISSSADLVETVIFDQTSPHCDPESLVASSFDDLLADWIYSYPEETELCCFFRFCLAMILAGLCCIEGAKAWRGSCPCVLLISSVLNFPDCWTFSHYQMKLGKQPFAGVTSIAQTNSTHISFYNYLWRLGWLTVHCQVMDTGFKRNTV